MIDTSLNALSICRMKILYSVKQQKNIITQCMVNKINDSSYFFIQFCDLHILGKPELLTSPMVFECDTATRVFFRKIAEGGQKRHSGFERGQG